MALGLRLPGVNNEAFYLLTLHSVCATAACFLLTSRCVCGVLSDNLLSHMSSSSVDLFSGAAGHWFRALRHPSRMRACPGFVAGRTIRGGPASLISAWLIDRHTRDISECDETVRIRWSDECVTNAIYFGRLRWVQLNGCTETSVCGSFCRCCFLHYFHLHGRFFGS